MKTVKMNNLFAVARRDTAPVVDVADSVLALLAERRPSVSVALNRSLFWMSMASSAIAACIVLAAFVTKQQNTDAVNEILNMVAWVAQ